MYDESGMVKPIAKSEEGDSGSSETPPAQRATKVDGAAEPTAVVEPSPAKTDQPGTAKATTEESGAATATGKAADQGKPPAAAKPETQDGTTAEETDDTLKAKYSRPEDKGPEWGIRAYRELRKTIAPIEARLQRINSTERVGRGLDFVAEFGSDTDIATAVDKLTALSSSRTRELSDYLYEVFLDHYPDNIATDLIGEKDAQGQPVRVTAAELRDAYKLVKSGATAGNAQPQPTTTGTATAKEPEKPADMSAEDWENFKVDYPLAYEAMKAQPAASQPPATAAPEKEDPKVTELTQKLTAIERQQLERQQELERTEILDKGQEFYTKAFSVVEEGLRDLGLTPDPAKDDDKTVRLKKEAADQIRSAVEAELDGPDGPNGSMDWSLCSDEQKENRKLAVQIMKLLSEKDYPAAFDYLEMAQVRYQLAFDRVAPAKMELYNAAMGQPSTLNRNAGQQEGHRRPEIDGSASAAGSNGENKTPWRDPSYRKPGETVWEAQDRYLAEHGLPGR